jgi:hypothetical protein
MVRCRAGGVHHPDVAKITEGDKLAVRRKVRRASETDLHGGQGRVEGREKNEREKQAPHDGDPDARMDAGFGGRFPSYQTGLGKSKIAQGD